MHYSNLFYDGIAQTVKPDFLKGIAQHSFNFIPTKEQFVISDIDSDLCHKPKEKFIRGQY